MNNNRDHLLTRRSVLKATAGAGAAAMVPSTLFAGAAHAGAGKKRKVPFGAALEYLPFIEDSDYTALFVQHCDIIVPMNSLKWDALQWNSGDFTFLEADGILNFSESIERGSYGHTFVWWNGLPPWVERLSTRKEAEAALIDHIQTVGSHYSGRVPAWDVVNEVIAHDPLESGMWRDSVWMRLLGAEHVDIAFAEAAKAAPDAELNINDYDLEFKGARYDARRKAILDLVRRLQDRNLKIDAVGIQGHLYPEVPIDFEGLGRFITDLAALGVDYRITEIDVIDWKLPVDIELRDERAASHVNDFLDAAFSAAPPLSVATWGLSDRYSWISDAMPHRRGARNRPLPFDENLKPKPMFDVIMKYVDA